MKKHSKQSKVSIRRFLYVSILIIGISTFSTMRLNATTIPSNTPSYFSYTSHDPISITSDSNFIDYVFPGSGTVEDPYVIEGYNITTTSNRGISITDTTEYFTVRNCYVDANQWGIYISNVVGGTATVTNNTCSNNTIGIYLVSSGSSTIANNTCNNNNRGISLDSSGSSTVANNTCNTNTWEGIYLSFSGSSMVTNNTCNYNSIGIDFYSSGSSTIANNTFTNCGLFILENTIDAYLSNTVENNWVNGKKLGFYTNLDSKIIVEPVYGQLILVNCTNVTVRDQILNNASFGLSLYHCTSSVVVNNTCSNNYYGIYLVSSGSSTVANNTCSDNSDIGIYLEYSGSSTVANNTCNYNQYGIILLNSGGSAIANNTCSSNNNHCGIYLLSDFCVVTYNLLQENEVYGIRIHSISDNNLIHHNNFVDNNLVGTSQAFDDGTNNYWHDSATLEGNYWSDWSGTGSYAIDGSAGAFDLYPLDEPVDIDPPLIVNIIHSPSTPTELDTVSINATVTDTSGVQSVTLHYRINGGNWIEVSMTLISGDLYSVTIGPFAASETIEYYVKAVDNSVNHNLAINDNSGLYYSFTVFMVIPEFQTLSSLLSLTIILLFLGCSSVLIQRRKK